MILWLIVNSNSLWYPRDANNMQSQLVISILQKANCEYLGDLTPERKIHRESDLS